jgi:hypothetical protein
MKHTILGILEFSLNTCLKTFLVEGEQECFDILVSNGYENVVEEICEMVERGLITNELDIDFCKKILAMHGSRKVLEDHIHNLEAKEAKMQEMNIRRAIRLQKPL